ncbi:uncharacterized protein LOC125004625 [Mugil cephalus]|uniref:uncharacterized protein LOC125004625 n=1 Tax=Mugil cephalus TaxID=48193 RepID=UPI001FB59FD7|nr:uncharacterized protein LOC125004625 [Mugil cephalus]
MKFLRVIMFCCLTVVCVEASDVLEVTGRVGGEVSVLCSPWSTDNSSEPDRVYFCKGVCSGESVLIQADRKTSAVKRQGRYSVMVDRGHGAFNVTIRKLKRADAGHYHCGPAKTLNGLNQEINLRVVDASTVPSGSTPSTTATLQIEAQTLTRGSSTSRNEPSPAALTLPPTEVKKNQQDAAILTDTTLVIIISGSLAFVVCAIIPVIFYGHWRSHAEDQNRPEMHEGGYCEENADVTSTHIAVELQSFEASAHDPSQYAAVYQALDPKALD